MIIRQEIQAQGAKIRLLKKGPAHWKVKKLQICSLDSDSPTLYYVTVLAALPFLVHETAQWARALANAAPRCPSIELAGKSIKSGLDRLELKFLWGRRFFDCQ